MRVLRELLIVAVAGLGWAAALRERDRAERITNLANNAASRIRHDAGGASFRFRENNGGERTFTA